jgi:hypothetical protein
VFCKDTLRSSRDGTLGSRRQSTSSVLVISELLRSAPITFTAARVYCFTYGRPVAFGTNVIWTRFAINIALR